VRLGSGQVVSSVLRVTGVRGFNAIAHGMAVIQQLIYCIARGERKSSLLLHALSLSNHARENKNNFRVYQDALQTAIGKHSGRSILIHHGMAGPALLFASHIPRALGEHGVRKTRQLTGRRRTRETPYFTQTSPGRLLSEDRSELSNTTFVLLHSRLDRCGILCCWRYTRVPESKLG